MRTSLKIKVISLDAMGTILELRESPQVTYFHLLRELGHDLDKISPLMTDPTRLRRYWRQAEAMLPSDFVACHRDRYQNYDGAPYGFWGLIFQVMFADLGLEAAGMLTALKKAYQYFATPAPWAVEPGLEQIAAFCRRRRIPMFVTSNWDLRLPSLLEALGVARHFAAVITSAQVGYEKPSARIFHYLADRAGVDPGHILHIGDSMEMDFLGARKAGLGAVLYDRRQRAVAEPYLRIQALQELIPILEAG